LPIITLVVLVGRAAGKVLEGVAQIALRDVLEVPWKVDVLRPVKRLYAKAGNFVIESGFLELLD
jgi:hypothetical protein